MSWFGRKKSAYRTPETAEALEKDIIEAREMRAKVVAQWPAIQAATEFLATRGRINGFGEEVNVTFTPSRNNDGTPEARHP